MGARPTHLQGALPSEFLSSDGRRKHSLATTKTMKIQNTRLACHAKSPFSFDRILRSVLYASSF